jgi:sirohydrochlorin ferrochelatase
MTPQPAGATRSTVLVAHGSPDPRHAADVAAIAGRVADLGGGEVLPAYLEHNTPRAADVIPAVAACADLVVLPLLLTAGFHWNNDIPAVVASGAGRSTLLAPPPLEAFAPAVAGLIRTHSGQSRGKAVVVLAGSRSPLLPERMAALLDRLEDILAIDDGQAVEVAVARDPAAAAPLLDASTVVVPLVVADGIFADRIRDLASAAGARATPVVGSTIGFAATLAAHRATAAAAR